jgi:EAL domain-containing protein (putative c-di-GMP-specific phosphodiesterase class I)
MFELLRADTHEDRRPARYLRCLPLSFIKIDRSFVGRLALSIEDRRVVEMTIAIARQFELETIAEGIEDAATYALLRGLGAHYAQGFLVGRPAPLSSSSGGPSTTAAWSAPSAGPR